MLSRLLPQDIQFPILKALKLSQRNDLLKKYSLCYCCVGFHTIFYCKSESRSFTCNGRHHNLLHRLTEPFTKPLTQSTPSQAPLSKTFSFTNSSATNMLLSNAIIGIRDRFRNIVPTRVLKWQWISDQLNNRSMRPWPRFCARLI